MCAPLLPRTPGGAPSSSARSSSLQGPVALTTDPRVHLDVGASEPVSDDRADGAPFFDDEACDTRVIDDDRAGFRGAEGIGEREPGVVGRGVEVGRSALESLRLKRRLALEHRVAREASVSRDIAKERQGVVSEQPSAQLPARDSGARVHRPGELERPYEVRREAEQRADAPRSTRRRDGCARARDTERRHGPAATTGSTCPWRNRPCPRAPRRVRATPLRRRFRTR